MVRRRQSTRRLLIRFLTWSFKEGLTCSFKGGLTLSVRGGGHGLVDTEHASLIDKVFDIRCLTWSFKGGYHVLKRWG